MLAMQLSVWVADSLVWFKQCLQDKWLLFHYLASGQTGPLCWRTLAICSLSSCLIALDYLPSHFYHASDWFERKFG